MVRFSWAQACWLKGIAWAGLALSLDPPADSGSSFPARFLHEEFRGMNPGMDVLPLACSAACPGFLAWGRGSGGRWGRRVADRVGAGQATAAGGPQAALSRSTW
jgi:hypothetical protein